jgi:dihydroorotate dehydrogenase
MSGEEAVTRIKLGAALIQIYSGWILKGPGLPAEIASALRNFEKQADLSPRNAKAPG